MSKLRYIVLAVALLVPSLVAAQEDPAVTTGNATNSRQEGADAETEARRKKALFARERADALEYTRQLRHEEAVPILERVVAADPKDRDATLALGLGLVHMSSLEKDEASRKRERARARTYLVKAKELGADSDLMEYYLSTIPGDGGGDTVFSERKEVNAAMQAGEQAFAHKDYQAAVKAYTQAMLLDPNLYTAVLFIGDSYFADNKAGSACEWFERAAKLNPNRETAFRYWGDALMRLNRPDEARSKYIEAIVAEPYNRQSWVGLKQWSDNVNVQVTHPVINSPKRPEGPKGDGPVNITLDINMLNDANKKDGTSAWATYSLIVGGWQAGVFKEKFPQEKEYRHTLMEESEALGVVASSVEQDLKKGKVKAKNLDPSIATLLKLHEANMLDAYVLLSRPDAGIAQDYDAYRTKNRDMLRRYLDEYVVPKVPAK